MLTQTPSIPEVSKEGGKMGRIEYVEVDLQQCSTYSNEDDHDERMMLLSDGTSTADSDRSPSLKARNLRSNLMQIQTDKDPLFYYEVINVLGVGSMGSVAKVRKRDECIGGSARREVVETLNGSKQLSSACFELPFIGGLLEQCFARNSKSDVKPTAFVPTKTLTRRSSNYEVFYALKSIHLNRVTDKIYIEELQNEIEILKKLDHPHIVRPIETFLHRNQLFIVMELCSGGDLYSRDPYTEEEAARIVSSVLSAVSYMHGKNIVHRDLKYENVLFVNDHPRAEIKLIDFGLSKTYGADKELTEGVGTIYTMAPEVLKGHYSAQADLWSIGVIAYMLLSSQMPFFGRKRRHIVEQIMNCQYDFKGRRWKRVSPQAKMFVEDLLVADPEERFDAEAASRSVWLNKRFTATVRGPTRDEIDSTTETLKKYVNYSNLKKLALMVIAHKSTSEEIGILRKVFQKYDKRKDGSIFFDEFKEGLSSYGFSDEQISRMFEAVDLDGTGQIRYTEFLAATIEAHGAIDEERLAEAFDRLDCDDSGYISADNLREILGEEFPQDRIDSIIREVDLTKNNHISYPEFLALWENKNEEERTEMYQSIRPESLRDSWREFQIEMNEEDEIKTQMSSENSENSSLGRANFIAEKKMSERKKGGSTDSLCPTTTVLKEKNRQIPEVVAEDQATNGDDPHLRSEYV